MTTYTIIRDPLGNKGWELWTAFGYSLDDEQHVAYADTKQELLKLVPEIQRCNCIRCEQGY